MKLYYKPGACSLASHIALREAGLPFTLVKVDLATKKTETGEDFFKINPKGQVPTLQLNDGRILTEGTAILQYIADLVPEKKLFAPVGDFNRYISLSWLNYIATELHKGFSPLFRPNSSQEAKDQAITELHKKLAYVDSQLHTEPPYSITDAYLFTVLRWATAILKFNDSDYPYLTQYQKTLAQRPAIQAALIAEGLQ